MANTYYLILNPHFYKWNASAGGYVFKGTLYCNSCKQYNRHEGITVFNGAQIQCKTCEKMIDINLEVR